MALPTATKGVHTTLASPLAVVGGDDEHGVGQVDRFHNRAQVVVDLHGRLAVGGACSAGLVGHLVEIAKVDQGQARPEMGQEAQAGVGALLVAIGAKVVGVVVGVEHVGRHHAGPPGVAGQGGGQAGPPGGSEDVVCRDGLDGVVGRVQERSAVQLGPGAGDEGGPGGLRIARQLYERARRRPLTLQEREGGHAGHGVVAQAVDDDQHDL